MLTLGVAADANVVIFERIKEESRAGRSVRAAIQTGYTKGFATIVDANVVTAITALVLFGVATASVRGFALMLLIGTAISMLTAVLATRALLSLLAGFKSFENPRFVGAAGRGIPGWLKLDFIGRRSCGLRSRGPSSPSRCSRSRSRASTSASTSKAAHSSRSRRRRRVSLDIVRAQTAKVGHANAVIQGRGASTNGNYQSFQIRTETLTTGEAAKLQSSLVAAVDAQAFGAKNVSSSFGRQIASCAILAILVSLLLIVGYISLRFQWQFAAPVIVALAHDVIITVGVYALSDGR